MKKIILLKIFLLLTCISAFSQDVVIMGKVTTSKKKPLENVNVKIRGKVETHTTASGEFVLKLAQSMVGADITLEFNLTGYPEKIIEYRVKRQDGTPITNDLKTVILYKESEVPMSDPYVSSGTMIGLNAALVGGIGKIADAEKSAPYTVGATFGVSLLLQHYISSTPFAATFRVGRFHSQSLDYPFGEEIKYTTNAAPLLVGVKYYYHHFFLRAETGVHFVKRKAEFTYDPGMFQPGDIEFEKKYTNFGYSICMGFSVRMVDRIYLEIETPFSKIINKDMNINYLGIRLGINYLLMR